MENHTPSLLKPYLISIACHVLFFSVLLFTPRLAPDKPFIPSVIDVSMVSTLEPSTPAPSAPSSETNEKKPVAKPPEPAAKPVEAAPEPAAAPKEAVSIAPAKPKVKTSLKKETFKPTKVVEHAIKKIEKKVESEPDKSVSNAIDRLRKKVGQEEKSGQIPKPEKGQVDAGAGAMGEAGKQGSGGKRQGDLIDLYRLEIAYSIQKNWAFAEQLAGDEDNLEASLVFKVMPNGDIRDITFTDRSGNEYLDDSAYKAIAKSNPVAPHPNGIHESYVLVGIRFGPKGLK